MGCPTTPADRSTARAAPPLHCGRACASRGAAYRRTCGRCAGARHGMLPGSRPRRWTVCRRAQRLHLEVRRWRRGRPSPEGRRRRECGGDGDAPPRGVPPRKSGAPDRGVGVRREGGRQAPRGPPLGAQSVSAAWPSESKFTSDLSLLASRTATIPWGTACRQRLSQDAAALRLVAAATRRQPGPTRMTSRRSRSGWRSTRVTSNCSR